MTPEQAAQAQLDAYNARDIEAFLRPYHPEVELAHLPGNSDYIPAALHQSQPAWGRRSRFEIEGKALMVSEVFLESFTPWPSPLPIHRSQRGKVSAAILPPTK